MKNTVKPKQYIQALIGFIFFMFVAPITAAANHEPYYQLCVSKIHEWGKYGSVPDGNGAPWVVRRLNIQPNVDRDSDERYYITLGCTNLVDERLFKLINNSGAGEFVWKTNNTYNGTPQYRRAKMWMTVSQITDKAAIETEIAELKKRLKAVEERLTINENATRDAIDRSRRHCHDKIGSLPIYPCDN
ncbi:MAG: hypothetical protein AB2689_20585 [Candidatus Thiodiazotropha taylori]